MGGMDRSGIKGRKHDPFRDTNAGGNDKLEKNSASLGPSDQEDNYNKHRGGLERKARGVTGKRGETKVENPIYKKG